MKAYIIAIIVGLCAGTAGSWLVAKLAFIVYNAFANNTNPF